MLTENIVRGTTDPEIDSVTRIEHSTASPPCQLKGRVWRASTKVKSQLNSYESINWFPDQTDPDATTFAFTQFTDATQSCQIIYTRPKWSPDQPGPDAATFTFTPEHQRNTNCQIIFTRPQGKVASLVYLSHTKLLNTNQ